MTEDIYLSSKNPASSTRAVIVLPEIFGMNGFIRSITDRFASELSLKAFALDHFYPISGQSKQYDYNSYDEPLKLMQQVTGDKFVEQFTTALDTISKANQEVKDFIVCGFCFGGRLTFLAGSDKRVKRLVSFYGAGADQANFYQDKTVVEALCQARSSDKSLEILALFGNADESIPEAARSKTMQLIEAAGISYEEKVYSAGHAFMNFERDNLHNKEAAAKAWADVMDFLKS